MAKPAHMSLNEIYARLDAGEIDTEEAFRLSKERDRACFSWLDWFLERIAG